jgi:uncharacterized protein YndB with AHSA1/START domain
MILKVIASIAFLVLFLLVIAGFRPSTIQIQRSRNIQASSERVFALINDFHNWPLWAPQDRDDPTMKRTFSGPDAGVGAQSERSGSGSTGKGRMSIVESEAPKRVLIAVDFTKPFEAHNKNEFTLEPTGTSTRVTWKMQGTNVYFMKVMGLFVNMDRLMGEHFERGLVNLQKVCEK